MSSSKLGSGISAGEDTAVSSGALSSGTVSGVSTESGTSSGVDPFVSVSGTGTMSGASSGDGGILPESAVQENPETPSVRDGVAAGLLAHGGITYSTGICPLLADDSEVRQETETIAVGNTELLARTPAQVLTNPVKCPTCEKQVDSHQLVFDNTNLGARDCAIAIAHRAHPVTKELIKASDDGDEEKASRIAHRHPLGHRILEILGLRQREDKS